MFEFLAPRGTEWDTPVIGQAFSMPPIPGPDVYNLRARRTGKTSFPLPERPPRISTPVSTVPIPNLVAATLDSLGVGSWSLGVALVHPGIDVVQLAVERQLRDLDLVGVLTLVAVAVHHHRRANRD
jgi:hypothetical protein